MKESLGKTFKRGLFAIAPVAISLAIIIWLLRALEDVFRAPLKWLLGDYYVPGLGILLALILILFVGGIINNFFIRRFSAWLDKMLMRIPLFKTFYNSVGDLMSYFQPKDQGNQGKMVVVEVSEMRFLALVTREDYEGMPAGLGGEDRVTVFVPFSYQIGGFTVTVPRTKIQAIDLSVEQGMRFIVTAGVKAKDKKP